MRRVLLLIVPVLSAVVCRGDGVSLRDYSEGVRGRLVEKIRETLSNGGRVDEVDGVVTLVGAGHFFLQREREGLKILCDGVRPPVGRRVSVRGTPSLEGGRVVLSARGWSDLGAGTVPEARDVSAEELVSGEGLLDGCRIAIRGRAIGMTENGFALKVGDVPITVAAETLPGFLANCERTHPRVRLTGIAEVMFDSSSLTGGDGYVLGVKVDVAAPGDIELLPDVVYLTAKRDRAFVLTVGALLAVLAVGLVAFLVVIFRQRRGLFRTRTIMAERKRMADDIHDTIEQHLVGAGMLLKINRLEEAQGVLVRAKREIRDIVWGLKNDDMMRLSPAEMIRQLAHEENVKGIYRVDTHLDGLPARMDAAAMRDLSLIVRETIGNAVKHGGAKHIAISADATGGGGWRLRLSNDGEPFDPKSAPGAKEGHFGIEGMKQRARRLGATLDIERRGKGMVVTVRSV